MKQTKIKHLKYDFRPKTKIEWLVEGDEFENLMMSLQNADWQIVIEANTKEEAIHKLKAKLIDIVNEIEKIKMKPLCNDEYCPEYNTVSKPGKYCSFCRNYRKEERDLCKKGECQCREFLDESEV